MKEVYTLDDLRQWPTTTPPLRLAVIGDPVAHSASPQMHNAALETLGIDVRYTRLHLRPEEVGEAFRLLAPQGFIGLNCTIPHKPTALALVDDVDQSARLAGGVNTVHVQPDGRLAGYSTDGPGFERAVREEFGVELRDLRVAVLGAGGGAGRAVAMQCAHKGSTRIVLFNRTLEKIGPLAMEIEREFPGCSVGIDDFDSGALEAQLSQSDLVVNCTALGMKAGEPSVVPAKRLLARHLVFDTIYTAARTPLMLAADAAGARSVNGLPMLLHQGAISFERWFERPAPVEVMRAALSAAAR